MKKYLLSLIFVTSLLAGTYDNLYSLDKDANLSNTKSEFMDGDFSKIVRFDALNFSDGSLSNTNEFDVIVKKLKEFQTEGKMIKVKIIGHSREKTDDYNELVVDSDTYANAIQNFFRSSLTNEESLKNSENFALEIENKLIENGIPKDIIHTEYRGSKDVAYVTSVSDAVELSNRVMVSVYVIDSQEKAPF